MCFLQSDAGVHVLSFTITISVAYLNTKHAKQNMKVIITNNYLLAAKPLFKVKQTYYTSQLDSFIQAANLAYMTNHCLLGAQFLACRNSPSLRCKQKTQCTVVVEVQFSLFFFLEFQLISPMAETAALTWRSQCPHCVDSCI